MELKEQTKNISILDEVPQQDYSWLQGTHATSPSYWIAKVLYQDRGNIVQIGSNDGKTGDPIYAWLKKKNGWSAVFVEPVPFLFERLKSNYSGEDRFSFENVVINDGTDATFYWVSAEAKRMIPDLPSWYDQLGGFSRSHIINHIPELEPFIQESTLPGMTLNSLLYKHGLESFNLFHIDTEGFDFKILSQLDLSRYRPEIILYERKHLPKNEEEESIRFLQDDYVLYNFGSDMFAIEKNTNKLMQATLNPLHCLRVSNVS